MKQENIKFPISLLWQLLCKIIMDLDFNKLGEDFFSDVDVLPENSYDLIYGLTLKLLVSTRPLRQSRVSGVSEDLQDLEVGKTIEMNTLRECMVYSSKEQFVWSCLEHRLFLKVLELCEVQATSKFLGSKAVKKLKNQLKFTTGVSSPTSDLGVTEAYEVLCRNYNSPDDELMEFSLFYRNEPLYLNLCRLANIVLSSELMNTDDNGITNINYYRADWFIIQQYLAREIWCNLQKHEETRGRVRQYYQPTIYSGKGGSFRLDALYVFKNDVHNDVIIDAKLYDSICIGGSNTYRHSANAHQLLAYKCAYPLYAKKKFHKDITVSGVDAWVLHFRQNATKWEKAFSGTKIYEGFGDIGVYIVDMFNGCSVSDLDKQIAEFVVEMLK